MKATASKRENDRGEGLAVATSAVGSAGQVGLHLSGSSIVAEKSFESVKAKRSVVNQKTILNVLLGSWLRSCENRRNLSVRASIPVSATAFQG